MGNYFLNVEIGTMKIDDEQNILYFKALVNSTEYILIASSYFVLYIVHKTHT